jgi:hypothetical protein
MMEKRTMHDELGGNRDQPCGTCEHSGCSESDYYVLVFARCCQTAAFQFGTGRMFSAADRTGMGQI